jgi:hypothetical protein
MVRNVKPGVNYAPYAVMVAYPDAAPSESPAAADWLRPGRERTVALPPRMRQVARLTPLLLITGLLISAPTGTAQGASVQTAVVTKPTAAKVAMAAGFDVSPAMRAAAKQLVTAKRNPGALNRPERGPAAAGGGFTGDTAVQRSKTRGRRRPRDRRAVGQLRRYPGHGQHPHSGRHPDPARPGGRRRPQPVRGNGQHRLGGLLQDRQSAAGPAQPGLHLGRLRGPGL